MTIKPDFNVLRKLSTSEYRQMVVEAGGEHIVSFGAQWCKHSMHLVATLEAYRGTDVLSIHKSYIDIDHSQHLAQSTYVTRVPTIRYIVDGVTESEVYGDLTPEQLDEFLRESIEARTVPAKG